MTHVSMNHRWDKILNRVLLVMKPRNQYKTAVSEGQRLGGLDLLFGEQRVPAHKLLVEVHIVGVDIVVERMGTLAWEQPGETGIGNPLRSDPYLHID